MANTLNTLSGMGRNMALAGVFLGAVALGEPASFPTHTPADLLQPFVGKHVITTAIPQAKGTVEIVAGDFPFKDIDGTVTTEFQTGFLLRPLPANQRDRIRPVDETKFSKNAAGVVTQLYENPKAPVDPNTGVRQVHFKAIYTIQGNSIVIRTEDCNEETCAKQVFYVTK